MHQRCANNDRVSIRRITTSQHLSHTNLTRKGNGSLKVTKNKDSVLSIGVKTEVSRSKTNGKLAFVRIKINQRQQLTMK
jgi:hypothetical protein